MVIWVAVLGVLLRVPPRVVRAVGGLDGVVAGLGAGGVTG